MGHKSLEMINQKLSHSLPEGELPESFQVIEPGLNPPTVTDVARRMLDKITTNADEMLDALILLAKRGHYQAAEYLLSEMHRLGAELKDADRQSLSDRLGPLVTHLQAEYYKRTAITIDADPPPLSTATDAPAPSSTVG